MASKYTKILKYRIMQISEWCVLLNDKINEFMYPINKVW